MLITPSRGLSGGLSGLTPARATRGPDFSVNGAFDTNTSGWSINFNGTMASLGGRLRITGDGGAQAPRAVQSYTNLLVGVVYEITVDGITSVGLTAAVVVTPNANGSTTGQIATAAFAAGTNDLGRKLQFTATATTLYVSLMSNASALGNFNEFDNYSIRQVIT